MPTMTRFATVVKFDATRPRNRSARFGLGLGLGFEAIDTLFAAEESPQEPEPCFESDAVARAYAAGQRIGRARIDAGKVRFSGWAPECVTWFWSGYRLAWDTETDRRLAEQAELDGRFEAAFEHATYCDGMGRGWDAERGGV